MNIFAHPKTRLLSAFHRRKPQDQTCPLDVHHHVRDAYSLLCDANRRAIQIPHDVVSVITEARRDAEVNKDLGRELEPQFWNVYGLLKSSIEPAEKARRSYTRGFYSALFVLLISQLIFLAGDYVKSKLANLEKQAIEVDIRSAANVPSGQAPSFEAVVNKASKINEERDAYHALVSLIIDKQLHLAEFTISTTPFSANGENAVIRLVRMFELDLLLVFLSGYWLPMLYGLLGACTFVLRKLSDEIEKLTFANDTRVRYSLRLNIGLVCGLAAGWFIKPGAGETGLVSLSPSALAFIAGYGSELFFVALDKFVHAFAPIGVDGSSGRNVREVTARGITTTSIESKEAHVAGRKETNSHEHP